MIIAPCSVRTMSEIATGVTASLLTRVADVTLKERRRLVLLLRETPLHTGHLRTMLALSEAGGIIMPPVPAFYAELQGIDEMIDQTLGRALDLFGIEAGITKRWGEDVGGAPARAEVIAVGRVRSGCGRRRHCGAPLRRPSRSWRRGPPPGAPSRRPFRQRRRPRGCPTG